MIDYAPIYEKAAEFARTSPVDSAQLSVVELDAIKRACSSLPQPEGDALKEAIAFSATYFGGVQKVPEEHAFRGLVIERYAISHTPVAGVFNTHPTDSSLPERAVINLTCAAARERAGLGVEVF